MKLNFKIAVIGAGNIGIAIAQGMTAGGIIAAKNITLTRRKVYLLDTYKERGFKTTKNNIDAVSSADIIIIAVEPHQADSILNEISSAIDQQRHTLISVVSGLSTEQIKQRVGKSVEVVRAMTNTAIAIRESMTCLASDSDNGESIKIATTIFNSLGSVKVIREELMAPATALAACGLAFFLRAIRAASQGGIEIGFHSEDAIDIAAQTAKGAASLLIANKRHPEYEIDKVTTPRGITISGLNQMEHDGFSSAMIQGVVTSARKAEKLYVNEKD